MTAKKLREFIITTNLKELTLNPKYKSNHRKTLGMVEDFFMVGKLTKFLKMLVNMVHRQRKFLVLDSSKMQEINYQPKY